MSRSGVKYNPVLFGTASNMSEVYPIPRKTAGSSQSPKDKGGVKYHTVPLETENSTSDLSFISRQTGGSGPSKNEPAVILSTWGIGWKIPTLMMASYFLALGIAVTHYLLFQHINGRNADGPNRVVAQSYVATASNILSNAFGFTLRGSLAIAFTQYLWHLLRANTMKVSTIELLFCLRTNPFTLFKAATLKTAPSLCVLAIFMWGTQVATGFPPGAITVITTQALGYKMVSAPTFNASFMGNGSGVDAAKYSVMPLEVGELGDSFRRGDLADGPYDNLLLRMSYIVMVSGEALTMPSACGINCSYVMEFEGPYLGCDNYTTTSWFNTTYAGNNSMAIYNGYIQDLGTVTTLGDPTPHNGTYSTNYFNGSTLTPLLANLAATTDYANTSVLARTDNVTCSFQRAKYTVNNTYVNGVHARTITAEPVDRLVNLIPPTYDEEMAVPGLTQLDPNGGGITWGTGPANWSDAALALYRDLQHCEIIESMLYYMEGNFTGYAAQTANTTNSTTSPGFLEGLGWSNFPAGQSYVPVKANGYDGVIVERTRFNTAFDDLKPAADSGKPQFVVNQGTLNDQLVNVTMSVMMAYNQWSTQVNATTADSVNIYSFSQPLNLILPYFISLAVALPFVAMGYIALIRNGVSATDGGFMQIIATSTGSAILDRAAAGGCLGGNESAPQELRDLKIQFGEFVGRGDAGIKRAGFGVEGEVRPLKKGAQYGIAQWI